MKFFITWDSFFTCLLIFAATTGLFYIPQNLDFLNPLKQALGDFDVTDIAQSRMRDDNASAIDTNIVLVNLSTQSRAGIAHMLHRLAEQKPSVLGIDAKFSKPKDPTTDSMLVQAMSEIPRLVLGSKINFNDSLKVFDSEDQSNSMFNKYSKVNCFFNMISDQEKSFRTVREFSPFELVNKDTVYNFATAVAGVHNPRSLTTLMRRSNSTESIRFRGNISSFFCLDASQVLDDEEDISIVRDKIVLMGFMDNEIDTMPRTLEDSFFTPLNTNYAGRTFPDMYGVVVHANVVSQLLHEEYINVMPLWLGLSISFVLCVLTVGMFNIFEEKAPNWYDALTILTFLIQSVGITFLHVLCFNSLHYKMNITVTLAILALTPTVHELYHNSVKPLFWKALNFFRKKNP